MSNLNLDFNFQLICPANSHDYKITRTLENAINSFNSGGFQLFLSGTKATIVNQIKISSKEKNENKTNCISNRPVSRGSKVKAAPESGIRPVQLTSPLFLYQYK